ncbi:MAG: hypothetical protein K8S16_04215 [Bacteroidales bacterium]|nr:hypothetical protein [Bacteroidales bacterium]
MNYKVTFKPTKKHLLVYTIYELIVKIDIAEIKPDHRKQGFGKVIIEKSR